jgi:hypothetical protein
MLEALARAGVDFVVIGGLAGGAHGSAYPTFDLDIVYARNRENLERLAAALRELGARLRGAPADLPFLLDAFATPYGGLDILSDPDGAPPYRELRAGAVTGEVQGKRVLVASLDHLIAMKEASGRPKDKLMTTEYRVISDELRAPKTEEV